MIALLAPLLVQAAAPGFAPRIDTPIHFSVSETRQQNTRTQRFAIDRRVVFRRAGDGYAAEVETLKVGGDTSGAGRLFEAMTRSTVGRRVVIRLDRAGAVTDVDDLDAVWDAQIVAMSAALAGDGQARAALVDSLLAPLRTMSRAARVKRIGEMIAPLIADRAYAPAPRRAITVPARGIVGAAALLAGTETITAQRDGRLVLDREASGIVGATNRSQSLRRTIDLATGLVTDMTDIETIETAGARLIVTRSIRILP